MEHRFSWSERLHQKADFTAVFRQGKRFVSSGLLLWVYARPDAGAQKPRLGLAIPRTFGNAVRRNRLKRLLREVFRLRKHELRRGVDLVFSARPIKSDLAYASIEPLVLDLWKKAQLLTVI